jgi:hypothetical protein
LQSFILYHLYNGILIRLGILLAHDGVEQGEVSIVSRFNYSLFPSLTSRATSLKRAITSESDVPKAQRLHQRRQRRRSILLRWKALYSSCYRTLWTSPATASINIPTQIFRKAWIRTQRPLLLHAQCNSVIREPRRDKAIGGRAVLDPFHKRQQCIMSSIHEARHRMHTRAQRSRLIWAGEIPWGVHDAARTVLHPGHKEKAVPWVQGNAAREERAVDLVVEVGATPCWDQPVGEAVVLDKFSAMSVEGGQVEVGGCGVTGVEGIG